MAKILKVKVKREVYPQEGRVHYVYPPEYDSKKIQVISYEHVGNWDAVIARDQTADPHEFCIGMVTDNDAPAFLQSADIEEMTYNDALNTGIIWRPQVELITDEMVIKSILAKVRTGTALTQKEMDAIDPDKPDRGLGKTRHFQDILDEYIGKM